MQFVSEINKVWQEIKVTQVTEAQISNVCKENNIILSADMLVTVKIPEIFNPDYLCHNIASSVTFTSNLFAIVIGTCENIQAPDEKNQDTIFKHYQITVPLYRANISEKAILDKFYIQNQDLQHFCIKLSAKYESIRVRTSLDLISQEFSLPIINNSFIDRRRVSLMWSNTITKAGEIATATIQPFASCTKRKQEAPIDENHQQISNQLPQQPMNMLPPASTFAAPGMMNSPAFTITEKGEIIGNFNHMVPIPVFVQMSNKNEI